MDDDTNEDIFDFSDDVAVEEDDSEAIKSQEDAPDPDDFSDEEMDTMFDSLLGEDEEDEEDTEKEEKEDPSDEKKEGKKESKKESKKAKDDKSEDDDTSIRELTEEEVSEDEEDDEHEVDFGLDDETDSEIADAAYQAKEYSDYLKGARDKGVELSDRFVALLAREGVDPDFVHQRGIYSIDGFNKHIEELESRVDPNAVLYPLNGTKEEISEFYERYEGIPKTLEGYKDTLFEDTLFKDEESRAGLKEDWMGVMGLSVEQAKILVENLNAEKVAALELAQEEYDNYVKEQQDILKDTYKDGLKRQMRDINLLLNQHGKDFLKEFKGDKVLKSAAFVDFLSKILDVGTELSQISLKGYSRDIRNLGDATIKAMYEKVENAPEFELKKEKGTEKEQKEYRRFAKLYDILEREMRRRGISSV